jgi:hypothetical protein
MARWPGTSLSGGAKVEGGAQARMWCSTHVGYLDGMQLQQVAGDRWQAAG